LPVYVKTKLDKLLRMAERRTGNDKEAATAYILACNVANKMGAEIFAIGDKYAWQYRSVRLKREEQQRRTEQNQKMEAEVDIKAESRRKEARAKIEAERRTLYQQDLNRILEFQFAPKSNFTEPRKTSIWFWVALYILTNFVSVFIR
jgi:hypothetical protein